MTPELLTGLPPRYSGVYWCNQAAECLQHAPLPHSRTSMEGEEQIIEGIQTSRRIFPKRHKKGQIWASDVGTVRNETDP